MEAGKRVRIVIEAVGDGHVRPEGVFQRANLDPIPFSGWLELLRLLEGTFDGTDAAALLSEGHDLCDGAGSTG